MLRREGSNPSVPTNYNGVMAARTELTPEGREQKLVDICFQIMMLVTSKEHSKHFSRMSNEQKAEWVRDQLQGCGFPTSPCGASWGVIDRNNGGMV